MTFWHLTNQPETFAGITHWWLQHRDHDILRRTSVKKVLFTINQFSKETLKIGLAIHL